MIWWHELPYWTRELIVDWCAFLLAVVLICGAAWATEWWQRRRRRR